ncbi:sugar phosphate isomerase/epimerase family protein [Acidicapsa acidisoli]|uniref:sugar phosphate isomerase/epimerase family protein n=1 Tax=Acidicapsa acidisoli TaxID=1615681 RepID=UPI0021E00F7D|nr:sugar phosphate isomerase/epimerase family protein [Acidicapsa acidisoli]
MQNIKPMQIGLVFWADQNAESVLRQLQDLELNCGQLGVPPELHCETALDDWKISLNKWQVHVTSAVCSYAGEDYSTLETIHQTVGFTAQHLRAERIARTKEVSKFAHSLGIPALSCHVGFIPTNPKEALYGELSDLTKLICDHCASHGQDFVLETGQEPADVLLAFIKHVDRQNLKVNFDPANMIIYASGDPLAALDLLSPHVLSVHCKDARFPLAGDSTHLGKECALGDGEVNFPAFLQQLETMNYQGALSIEREEPNIEKRLADINTGILRLKQWKSNPEL